MATVNAALEAAMARPFAWGSSDCLSLVEAVHGFERSGRARLPQPQAYALAAADRGVLAGYEGELRLGGLVELPWGTDRFPGMVAIVRIAGADLYCYAVADDALVFRGRSRWGLITPRAHRLASLWGPA